MKSYDEKLYDHFVELSAKFDELKIEVTSLRKENKQLKKQVEKLTIKKEKNEIIIKKLKAENKTLKLENQKLKNENEVLYFLKDFKIPATNNQSETDQRLIKIKQKIGKFRSYNGASRYAIIRSCVTTYKKTISIFLRPLNVLLRIKL